MKNTLITCENQTLKQNRIMLKERRVQRHKEKVQKQRVKVDGSMDEFMNLVQQ